MVPDKNHASAKTAENGHENGGAGKVFDISGIRIDERC